MKLSVFSAALTTTLLFSAAASAEDYVLTLKDHQFAPIDLTIPANEKIKLTVKNEDSTPAEFESHDFKAEKIIPGNSEASLFVGPLKPGTYKFVDEFHEETAKGTLTVK